MKTFEDKVARFIQANRLFAGAPRILLAVSGGADSMALLHVMRTLAARGTIRVELVCAHINHQLRGAAGDGDETFVRAQAAGLGLPLVVRSVDVRAVARARKLSVETAGRELRLACLGEIARAEGCPWIATAHQKNDNAETVLHRLLRGTGFRGLAGIWPARQLDDASKLARPLLDSSRTEITDYLQAQNLGWREDATNRDCAHTRNFIRHLLLPAIQRESSDALVPALTGLAVAARKLHQRVARQAQEAAIKHVRSGDSECCISAAVLASLPEMVAVEMIRCQLVALGCGERELAQRHYRGILELVQSEVTGHTLTLPNGFFACRESEQLILRRAATAGHVDLPASGVAVDVPGASRFGTYRIETRVLAATEAQEVVITGNSDPFLEYLDLDRITLPLVVRPRRNGDRFQPLGLAAPKKVGKFLTTTKVPERLRQRVLVFEDGQGIVWLCPVRIGERAKVTEQTRQILALRVSRPY